MRSFLWSLPNHQLSGVLSRRFATLLPLGVLFCLAFLPDIHPSYPALFLGLVYRCGPATVV
jgi:hypothetical protein